MVDLQYADLAPPPDWLAAYRPAPLHYDEMVAADGRLRPHWMWMIEQLRRLGSERLGAAGDELRRLLAENGITYNVFGDPRASQRPWDVDPVPLVMDGAEWERIQHGLNQRARLLNALLADIYGARTVIRSGLVPASMIHAHPAYFPVCHQLVPRGGRWATFLAVDLARDADGRIMVLGDRVQAPSGAGYALENRILQTRVLPELYRDAPLRRLAGFLEAERSTLAALAGSNGGNTRIALLSPGPRSALYFEHAFLANYLSLTLVEGKDLVVRDGRVWLKTLGGLERLDVILRRVHDRQIDPLELDPAAGLGLPGLLQAIRVGGVAVANVPGSGVIEHPGLAPLLPQLCRHFLDEDLLLPSPETWWCGDAVAYRHVRENLADLVLRRLDDPNNPVSPAVLDDAGRAALIADLERSPERYVGQRAVRYSTTPVMDGGVLVARPVVLRGFVVAEADDYRTMPGGLARVSSDMDHPEMAIRRGAISKDLWVLAPGPERHITLLRQAAGPVVVTRDGLDLPSRVADDLFWLGRYGERTEGKARLLREALQRLAEQSQPGTRTPEAVEDLFPVLELAPLDPHTAEDGTRGDALRQALMEQLNDLDDPVGFGQALAGMLRTGQAVRDHLGEDSWRAFNRLQQRYSRLQLGLRGEGAREFLQLTLNHLAAFFGLVNETMPHHLGWVFLDIGRQLERVQFTLALLRLAFLDATHRGVELWEVVLIVTDNLTAYRRRYRSALHPAAIMDLLLFDERNPRSVGYQLRRLGVQIERLHTADQTPYRSSEQRLILQAGAALGLADIGQLAGGPDDPNADAELLRLLDALEAPLTQLSDALVHGHFSHADTPHQLVVMQQ